MMRPPRGDLVLHQADRLLRAQEHAGQVDVDHVLPLLERQVLAGARGGAFTPALLNSTSSAAERLARLREQRRDGRRVGHVGRHGEPCAAPRPALGDRLLQRLARGGRRARRGSRPRSSASADGLADAAAGAGDDRDLLIRFHGVPCRERYDARSRDGPRMPSCRVAPRILRARTPFVQRRARTRVGVLNASAGHAVANCAR